MKKYIKSLAAAITIFAILGFGQPEAQAATLTSGTVGSDVTYVQSILKKLGYFKTETTGYYGPITVNAVKQFQRDFGIETTGGVGPKTAQLLNEMEMMAHVVYGEARGESYQGQVAVAAVVLNRVDSNDFPDTVRDVVFQRNAFTAINDGQYYLQPNDIAYHAVKDALLGWDPSNSSLYYYNPRLATSQWIFTRTVTKQIGNHYFAY
ncbi:cell wall hydrolase [Mesobacillus subterraneus]|uniref:cell wall hydrolase n=1 Tax=Mesobacillus subterraneus TaxID=285983 RepID=UPI001FE90E03|nr:cell wall hydrolase [Mesobacillus subterraneus]